MSGIESIIADITSHQADYAQSLAREKQRREALESAQRIHGLVSGMGQTIARLERSIDSLTGKPE